MAKPRYRRHRYNRTGVFFAVVVVLILMVAVSVKSVSLMTKEKEYQTREDQLQAQIDEETQRTEEINDFEKYTHTKKYIEDIAKEKLGLVYPGEIIFKNENAN